MERVEQGGPAFDLDADMASLSEHGLHELCKDLAEVDADVAGELRKTVLENYQPFITASQARAYHDASVARLRRL